MEKVKRYSGDPIGEAHFPAADEKIRYGAQSAEKKPIARRNRSPKKGRGVFPQQPNQKNKNTPDVKIVKKPKAKAVYKPLQQHKNIAGVKSLKAINKGEAY